jgi:serine/threonine protein kinase
MTLTIVGSSGYAPLEQYWGKAVPASDLYGLGATLIHLLSGRPPQDALQGESHLWAESLHISAGFQRWLERMTHSLPEKRYLTAREALDSLQTLDQVVSERSFFSLKSKSVSANRLKRYPTFRRLSKRNTSSQGLVSVPLY